MSQIQNAFPRAILLGVDDQSKRTLPYESNSVPIHLPHVFSYAAWGPENPTLVVGSTANNLYGQETFEPRGAYTQHQWPLIDRMLARNNAMVFQRIRPEDAPDPATVTLSLDVLQTDVTLYTRNADGSYKLDAAGKRIPTGKTQPGIRMQWVVSSAAGGKLGVAKKVAGKLTDKNNKQSTIYPILEFQTSFFGAAGNNRGLALWAPTMESDNPVNSRVVEDQRAQLYRLRFVTRDNARTSGKTVRTLQGAEYIDFSFRDDVVDSKTGVEFGFETSVLDKYRNLNTQNGQPRRWGPFNASYLYETNLNDLLKMLYAVEQPVNAELAVTTDPDAYHLINFVSGVHYSGIPYYAIEVLGANDGASPLTENTLYYAAGGGDGTMSKEAFDVSVGNICEDYAEGKWQLGNRLKFPQSMIYDTGFDSTNKFKLLQVLSARKDIAVVASTQDIALAQNGVAEESSMATILQTQASLHPESEYYGTPVMRAVIVGHSGHLINSKYRKLVPMTVDLADKLSAYAGNARGSLTSGAAPDVNPNNLVTLLKDVNCTFKTETVRNADWANGLVWVESFDQDDALFYPGLQTAYNDDTSVLNSVPTMMIFGELEKVCVRVWARLTGRSDLTNEQFAQRSNELILELTERRFDNRVIIVPDTYYTDMDDARGFSWTCNIKVYANNMKTVGSFTIEAHRQEELTA